jgi:SAM-dependent methyltransferase
MAQEDKERWDKKYQNNPIPNIPIQLLTQYAHLANKGKALDIACGMGRHSRYLASQGFEVDALDISSIAIDSLQNIPNINPKEVDFDTYILPADSYNLIFCSYFLKRELFPQIIDAMQDNAILIYETFLYHPDNDNAPSNRSFLLEIGELKEAFKSCEIIHYSEYWSEDMKGDRSMKASLVARRLKTTY